MSTSPIITDVRGDLLPNPHPGEILLEEFLKPMGLSQNRVAREIRVPPLRINELVLGKRAVTAWHGPAARPLFRRFGGLLSGSAGRFRLDEAAVPDRGGPRRNHAPRGGIAAPLAGQILRQFVALARTFTALAVQDAQELATVRPRAPLLEISLGLQRRQLLRRPLYQTAYPIFRIAVLMNDTKNANLISFDPEKDRIRKARDKRTPRVPQNESIKFRFLRNALDTTFHRVHELGTQPRLLPFVPAICLRNIFRRSRPDLEKPGSSALFDLAAQFGPA